MKYFEVKCTLHPFNEDAADILSASLSEIGFEAFSQTEDGLLAYIQQNEWDEDKMREVVQDFCLPEVRIRYSKVEAPDEDWNQVWEEEGFQPVLVGDEIVVHDVKHTDVPQVKYDILITPRLAFGTGSHETTRLILRTLAQLDLDGKHIIDAGTGTGILAIMAMKRGAESVFAYDIDEWSVENTKDNLLLNHIYNNVEVVCGDSSVLEGKEKADLLIANINRNILLGDLPRFSKSIREGGQMILSGFYLEDVQALTEAASKLGFSLLETESEEGWAMLLFEANALGRRDI
ncbi:MAG: 50S ribosomal protein L11 methyltransferase [Bacteroidaceae bacterium]|nr:50S ribosomal protein L11 methyltransferase [Bacteroidaceae bacterium]